MVFSNDWTLVAFGKICWQSDPILAYRKTPSVLGSKFENKVSARYYLLIMQNK